METEGFFRGGEIVLWLCVFSAGGAGLLALGMWKFHYSAGWGKKK